MRNLNVYIEDIEDIEVIEGIEGIEDIEGIEVIELQNSRTLESENPEISENLEFPRDACGTFRAVIQPGHLRLHNPRLRSG